MSTTPCSQRELAVGWALHALEPEEEARVAAHLPQCPECRERVAQTERTAALLGAATPQLDPPARLRASILAAARAAGPAQPATAEPAPRPVLTQTTRVARPRRVLVAAAAAVVLALGAAGGWAGSRLGSDPASTPAVAGAAPDSVVQDLASPGVRQVVLTDQGSTTPVAVLLTANDHDLLLPVNLPAVAASDSVWVWGVQSSGVPVPLGNVVDAGAPATAALDARQVAALPAAGQSYERYALSVEPGQAVPTVPTTVIASGQVRA